MIERDSLSRYYWKEGPHPPPGQVDKMRAALDIPPAAAKFLVSRSIDDQQKARRYLFPDASMSHDPFLFRSMDKAVDCIKGAAAKRKRIMVHGDYDVDGISGTALLYLYLKSIGFEVLRFLPDRRKDGYGLSKRAAEWAMSNCVGLVIAVDCGTSDGELVGELLSAGIDVIICDHHEFPFGREVKGITLNPTGEDEDYPFKLLCGTGIAFKLVQALHKEDIRGRTNPEDLLDLLALATVGDLVPLVGENRYFAREGIRLINTNPRVGLKALLQVSSSSLEVTETSISYRLAPRLNAPGRLSSPKPSLELLCTDSEEEAQELAGMLEMENSRRRELTEVVKREALEKIEAQGEDKGGFVLASEKWDEGVLGIVASRVVELYGKPAVLLSISGEIAKGSGRSVPGVHLKEQLDGCKELLLKYGGHSQAVGLTIECSQIEAFADKLSSELKGATSDLPPKPVLCIDSEILLDECTMELAEFFASCRPFGYGNREPVMKLSKLTVKDDTAIVGNGHLKLRFIDESDREGEAIYFNGGIGVNPLSIQGKLIDLAVKVRKGFFLERFYPELVVADMRFNEGS